MASRPENYQQWASFSKTNLAKAHNLANEVLDQLRQNEAAEVANKEALEAGIKREKDRVRVKVHTKVKAHSELINCTQRQMRDIEDALVQSEGVQFRLTHERYAQFANQIVCERRLELRKGRPAQETFNDATQTALERERQVLMKARETLVDYGNEAQKFLKELRSIRCELSKDTGSRRLAISHDLATLRPLQQQPPPSQATTPKAGGTSTNGDAVLLPECGHRVSTKLETQQFIQRSADLVVNVYALKRRAENLIQAIRAEAAEAIKRVEQALAKRTRELSEVQKKFQALILEVEHAKMAAERALETAEERLDPAGGDAAQQEKVATLRTAVANLTKTKHDLVEDLRQKIAALNIDNSCRRCTPQVACEPKKQLRNSNSAPSLSNFRQSNGMMALTQGSGTGVTYMDLQRSQNESSS